MYDDCYRIFDNPWIKDIGDLVYTDTSEKSPDNAVMQENLGWILLLAHRKEEALQHLWAAVQLDPLISERHISDGMGYRDAGLADKAILASNRTLVLDAHNVVVRYNFAMCLEKMGGLPRPLSTTTFS